MLFNSWTYFLFFPTVTAFYFLFPHSARWSLLLFASCVFYMAFVPQYILILFALIIVDYFAGIWIENSAGRRKDVFLWMSVVTTATILFVFKYFNFFNANVAALAQAIHWNYSISALSLILPIGLSFHTFQSLSYVIEVYRGEQKAERNLGIYALYVMFFPQLVAGPIERPQNLLHQFYERHYFNPDDVTRGLRLIAWGLFKKVVIADRLALFVGAVFEHPRDYHGISLILATLFFTIQVYCDFSGYSDIAIGSARVLGFRLMTNFDRPYAARSLAEFWKRWHISLSTWLRDYIYEPCAIRWRGWGTWGVVSALVLTFAFSGLWHGAAWTFVVWGLFHGTGLGIETLTMPYRRRLAKRLPHLMFDFFCWLGTFVFVSLSYVFFRANSIQDAVYILSNFGTGLGRQLLVATGRLPGMEKEILLGQTSFQFIVAVCAIVALEVVQAACSGQAFEEALGRTRWWFRWPSYYALTGVILFFGMWFGRRNFIYFQF